MCCGGYASRANLQGRSTQNACGGTPSTKCEPYKSNTPYLENLRERKAVVAVLRVVGDELADEIASPVASSQDPKS